MISLMVPLVVPIPCTVASAMSMSLLTSASPAPSHFTPIVSKATIVHYINCYLHLWFAKVVAPSQDIVN